MSECWSALLGGGAESGYGLLDSGYLRQSVPIHRGFNIIRVSIRYVLSVKKRIASRDEAYVGES